MYGGVCAQLARNQSSVYCGDDPAKVEHCSTIAQSASREAPKKRSSLSISMCTLPSCLCRTNRPPYTQPHEGASEGAISGCQPHSRVRIDVHTQRHRNPGSFDERKQPTSNTGGPLDRRKEAKSEHARRLQKSNINCQVFLMH